MPDQIPPEPDPAEATGVSSETGDARNMSELDPHRTLAEGDTKGEGDSEAESQKELATGDGLGSPDELAATHVSDQADANAALDASTLDYQKTAAERSTSWGDPNKLERRSREMPKEVAGYELLEEIARGGMGVVYKARQVTLQRTVALKMILSGPHASDEEVQRFFSEAQSAAQLNHPAIVPIYEVGQWEHSPFFSMEYVEGQTLAAMTRDRPLEPRRAAECLSQVADAIDYAHHAGILHRDLKPGNVLVNKQGQVKVTDFGLAKQVESDSDITASGAVLGTPSFMPPEQALGKREKIGPASDVYSLGAMLYAVLVGRAPFQAASTAQTLMQVINQPPIALRDLDSTIPRDLDTICAKCLEKEPESRYRSALEFADDLRRFLAGETIHARRANAWERGLRWCRRNRIAAALIASLGVAVLVSLLAVTFVARSLRLERLANLQTAFASALDEPELGAEYIRQVDSVRRQVAEMDPEVATGMQTRFKQDYAEFLRQRIEQPRLSEQDRERISASLIAVRQRYDDVAWDSLDRLLANSASRWQTVAELGPPYDDYSSVFPTGSISRVDNQLFVSTVNDVRYAFVPTAIPTSGDVFVEVEFDQWETRRYVGFAIDCYDVDGETEVSFEALVHAPQKMLAQPLTELPLMGESDESELQIDIRRRGLWLGHTRVTKPSSGPLRLALRREGRQFQLQLNQESPLEVEVLFPQVLPSKELHLELIDLPLHDAGELAFAASALKVQRRELAPEPHPLEAGDQAFTRGDFVVALELYQNRSPDWSSDLVMESQYKSALALIQLQRGSEAEVILAELAGTRNSNWQFRAYAQLWTLALQNNRLQEAEIIAKQLMADESFERLVVQLPPATIDKLLTHYGSDLSIDADNFSVPPERLEQWKRATLILEAIGAPMRAIVDSRWDLSTAYLNSDQPEEALSLARRTLEEFPNTEAVRWRALGMYANALLAADLPAEQITREFRPYFFEENGELTATGLRRLDTLIHVYLALNQPKEALELLEREDYVAFAMSWLGGASHYYLMLGLAHRQNGALDKANESWRQGLALIRQHEGNLDRYVVDAFALLAGLTHDVYPEDIPRMLSAMTVDQLGGPVMDNLRKQFISDAEIASIIRHLHRSPESQQYVEVAYLGKYSGKEANFLAGRILGLEVFRQMVGGIDNAETFKFPPDLDRELRAFYDQAQQAAWDHELGNLQITQVAMAYQGVTGVLGWSGLHASLPKPLLAPVGYLLGSHLVNRGKVETGLYILRDSLELAPEDSALYRAINDKISSTQ